jgi:hypothetical protein
MFLSFGLSVGFGDVLGVLVPRRHGHAVFEVVRNVALPLIPRLQSLAAEPAGPAFRHGLGSFLPPRLDDVEKAGVVEVFHVLSQVIWSEECPINHISLRAVLDAMVGEEVLLRGILSHAKCAHGARI